MQKSISFSYKVSDTIVQIKTFILKLLLYLNVVTVLPVLKYIYKFYLCPLPFERWSLIPLSLSVSYAQLLLSSKQIKIEAIVCNLSDYFTKELGLPPCQLSWIVHSGEVSYYVVKTLKQPYGESLLASCQQPHK